MVGFEPTTPALRKRCSTVELHRLIYWVSWRFRCISRLTSLATTPAYYTRLDSAMKTKKLSKDFPLFLHPTGQWAKKVRGQDTLLRQGPKRHWN